MKRLLKFRHQKIFGLDIGSSTVKIVQLDRNGAGYTVSAAGMANIAGESDNGNADKDTLTSDAINKCIKSAGINIKLAVCSVAGPEVAVRPFEFPLLPREEIKGAVNLEASQVCPFNADDAIVDYQLIQKNDEKTQGFLVSATNNIVEKTKQYVKNADINCVFMDVDGLALLNCFSECEKSEVNKETTAILNVGSSTAILAIMKNNSLPFVRDIDFPAEKTIEQIAFDKNISKETFKKTCSNHISDNEEESQSEPGKILRQLCQTLIDDIKKTLHYYKSQPGSVSIEKLLVCGGFAQISGFVDMLNSNLAVNVVSWSPFDKIPCDVESSCKDIIEKNGPAMAVAAGLAMREI
ncbi:MAG: type IV pilus assembly protein PilM [Planctomycetota bacterium]|jgi:type IV pilus assembly protein PilM